MFSDVPMVPINNAINFRVYSMLTMWNFSHWLTWGAFFSAHVCSIHWWTLDWTEWHKDRGAVWLEWPIHCQFHQLGFWKTSCVHRYRGLCSNHGRGKMHWWTYRISFLYTYVYIWTSYMMKHWLHPFFKKALLIGATNIQLHCHLEKKQRESKVFIHKMFVCRDFFCWYVGTKFTSCADYS